MHEDTTRAELAQLRAEFAAFRARAEAEQRPRPRHRLPRRILPSALVVLLVALTPFSLLAVGTFDDLTGGVHDANIQAIYDAAITKGCVPNVSYCPTANVTREEMVSFLARTAGLGGNPAVANAKTAQTATNATNATNAVHATNADTATTATTAANATNAQSAANATLVGGKAPSDLIRVARAFNLTVGSGSAVIVDRVTLSITAPTAGFVLINGTVIANGGASCPCSAHLLVRHVQGNVGANDQFAVVGNAGQSTIPMTWVFPVGAGVQTFILRTGTGVATTVAFGNPTLTALYVPYGSGGGGILATEQGLPQPPQPPQP